MRWFEEMVERGVGEMEERGVGRGGERRRGMGRGEGRDEVWRCGEYEADDLNGERPERGNKTELYILRRSRQPFDAFDSAVENRLNVDAPGGSRGPVVRAAVQLGVKVLLREYSARDN